jgi:hypothetical protein
MPEIDKTGRTAGVLTKSGLLVREPIVLANLTGALLLEVCILLRQFGVPLTDGQVDAINAVAGLLLLIAAAVFGRKLTTPLADPRDNLGQALTPELPDLTPAPGVPEVAAAEDVSKAQMPLDAPHLPPRDGDVAKHLPSPRSGIPKRDGDDPIGGLRRKL